jgi:hypothetical protein
MKALHYIYEHLKQESTWRGAIALAMAFGLQVSPEMQTAILTTGLALIGLINAIKDK